MNKYMYMNTFHKLRDDIGTVEYNKVNTSLYCNLYNQFTPTKEKENAIDTINEIQDKLPKKGISKVDKELLFPKEFDEVKKNEPPKVKKVVILPPKESVLMNNNIKKIIVDPETAKPNEKKLKKNKNKDKS